MVAGAEPKKRRKSAVYRARNLVADALKAQGVEFVFGVIGYPIHELGIAVQKAGLKYVAMHNEQAASYAAAAIGYLTGRPGVVLTVTGPGVIHAVAGMANAKENCWPLVSIGGASESSQEGQGSFQEARQLHYVSEACKFARRVTSAAVVPRMIEQAVRVSMTGRPGACHLDLPADILREQVDVETIDMPLPARGQAITLADPAGIAEAVGLLRAAQSPLIVVGKGAAYARAENELLRLVEQTNMPFLPTPMGKGCIPDDHAQCISPARSAALKVADVIILVGARLNWILHFGRPPRYSAHVKFIKIDVAEEEMDNGKVAAVRLVGHARGVVDQLNHAIANEPWALPTGCDWWHLLRRKIEQNCQASAALASDRSTPMNFYCAITAIQREMARDAFVMGEGANTMDIGRSILQNYLPRHRLDAGTFGTMGVGLGQMIAASLVYPGKKVVGVLGDSAFGFSMAEYETLVRLKLNALVIVMNNNGVGGGPTTWKPDWEDGTEGAFKAPITAFVPAIRYHALVDVFGGRGWEARGIEELETILPEAMAYVGPGILHIHIDPKASRKAQEFPFGDLQSMLSSPSIRKSKL